jgi:hypothetical protein
MTFVEPIPGALIEEDVHGNTRHQVDVSSGYDNDRRRSRDPIRGRRTYADVHTDLRTACGKARCDEQKKSRKQNQLQSLCSHKISSYE